VRCAQRSTQAQAHLVLFSDACARCARADYNDDVARGAVACPAKVDRSGTAPEAPNCPFKPIVSASAFASRTFDGSPLEFFGKPTMDNIHTLFPPYAGVKNASWFNVQAYSYHSYGKEGYDLGKATTALINLVNAAQDGPPLPIYTTEHASKTASSWNLALSSSDDQFEASRLASQVIHMAVFGQENCACGAASEGLRLRCAARKSPSADAFRPPQQTSSSSHPRLRTTRASSRAACTGARTRSLPSLSATQPDPARPRA
jgi:hypothetical protein